MRHLPLLLLLSLPALGAQRELPFTWTSRTSEAGHSGLEVWLTPRLVRSDDYFRLDARAIWTHGVARALETQLSVDVDIERTGSTEGLDPKLSSLWKWTTWGLSPFAVGGMGRLSLGPNQFEAEARLIADLRLGRLLVALNASAARALFWKGREGVDTRLEESLAVQFAISPQASVGLEGRGKSSWAGREYRGSAVYVGPTLAFRHPKFWVMLGGYAQIAAQKAGPARFVEEPSELTDNERFIFRLALGGDV